MEACWSMLTWAQLIATPKDVGPRSELDPCHLGLAFYQAL